MSSGLWKPSEGPINQPKPCIRCGKMKEPSGPGYITFHICNTRGLGGEVIQGELVEEQKELE